MSWGTNCMRCLKREWTPRSFQLHHVDAWEFPNGIPSWARSSLQIPICDQCDNIKGEVMNIIFDNITRVVTRG